MKKKRILSWLLAIAIVISSLPISALLPAKTVLAADLTVVAPNDATVVAGNTAEFTVEASGGTEPYTYQWEESTDSAATWNAIDGAISATYTIDSTTIEMDNYQYRCVVQRCYGACQYSDIRCGVAEGSGVFGAHDCVR